MMRHLLRPTFDGHRLLIVTDRRRLRPGLRCSSDTWRHLRHGHISSQDNRLQLHSGLGPSHLPQAMTGVGPMTLRTTPGIPGPIKRTPRRRASLTESEAVLKSTRVQSGISPCPMGCPSPTIRPRRRPSCRQLVSR